MIATSCSSTTSAIGEPMTTHPTDAEIDDTEKRHLNDGIWPAWHQIRMLHAAARDRNRLEAENAKLREAYRKEVILTAWTAGNYGSKPHHHICEACGGEWTPSDAERHEPACLARPSQLETDNG